MFTSALTAEIKASSTAMKKLATPEHQSLHDCLKFKNKDIFTPLKEKGAQTKVEWDSKTDHFYLSITPQKGKLQKEQSKIYLPSFKAATDEAKDDISLSPAQAAEAAKQAAAALGPVKAEQAAKEAEEKASKAYQAKASAFTNKVRAKIIDNLKKNPTFKTFAEKLPETPHVPPTPKPKNQATNQNAAAGTAAAAQGKKEQEAVAAMLATVMATELQHQSLRELFTQPAGAEAVKKTADKLWTQLTPPQKDFFKGFNITKNPLEAFPLFAKELSGTPEEITTLYSLGNQLKTKANAV